MFARYSAVVVVSLWGVLSHGQQLSEARSNLTGIRRAVVAVADVIVDVDSTQRERLGIGLANGSERVL